MAEKEDISILLNFIQYYTVLIKPFVWDLTAVKNLF